LEYVNNLKRLRLVVGLRQADIAASLNIGQAEYSRIESGKRKITPHQPALAKAFGVEQNEITEEYVADVINSIAPTETLPVYGFPSPDGDGLNFSKQMMSKVDCPPDLAAVDGAYACFCYCNKLSPKICAGDLAFVNPNMKPKTGSLVIVRENGKGFMGILTSLDKDGCSIETLEPQEELEFSRDIESVDQIVMVKYDL
jgi:transcriptional regulator with XRE-family HTH domain